MLANEPVSRVQRIEEQIRRYVCRSEEAGAFRSLPSCAPPRLQLDFATLKRAAAEVGRTAPLVGEMPPCPRTVRGRFGAVLVRVIRRLLSWYTPPIAEFQRAVAWTTEKQTALTELLIQSVEHQAAATIEAISESQRQAAAGETLAAVAEAATRACKAQSEKFETEMHAREALAAQLAEQTRRLDSLVEWWRSMGGDLPQRCLTRSHQEHPPAQLPAKAAERLPEEDSHGRPAEIHGGHSHDLDQFYVNFENQFRGTRALVMDRLRVYLPLLREHMLGTEDMPALDVGCGRGEWLELLARERLKASGVDQNWVMVEMCRRFGLQAEQGNVLAYLKTLENSSVGVVTGFHIVEHLSLEVTVALLDETVRVLKPGGMAIFETPNPANLLVASNTFFLDPTHKRPLPSALLRFLAEARGLRKVRVLPLHPYPESFKIDEPAGELTKRFNDYFYGAQDYAIIGFKS